MDVTETGAVGAIAPVNATTYPDRRVLSAIGLITVIAMIAALLGTRGMDPLRSDSASYIAFDPSRSVGYPAFIALVRLLTGNPGLVVPAQIVLLAASLMTLGRSFYDYTRRPLLSVVFQVVLISGIEVWQLSAVVLTEALAATFVAVWCAQLLQVLRSPKLSKVVVLVGLAALATTVRPPFVILFIATGVAAFVARPQMKRAPALAPIVAAVSARWAAAPIAPYAVHGPVYTTSPFARGA